MGVVHQCSTHSVPWQKKPRVSLAESDKNVEKQVNQTIAIVVLTKERRVENLCSIQLHIKKKKKSEKRKEKRKRQAYLSEYPRSSIGRDEKLARVGISRLRAHKIYPRREKKSPRNISYLQQWRGLEGVKGQERRVKSLGLYREVGSLSPARSQQWPTGRG